MAEGIIRQLFGDRCSVESAGTRPCYVHPKAIQVMAEIGIDISGHRSKHVDEVKHLPFDIVITICDHAKESCPVLPGTHQKRHWSFEDPVGVAGSNAEQLNEFRRVRDQIYQTFKEKLGAYLT